MKFAFLQTGGRLVKDVLDWIQSSKEQSLKEGIQDRFTSGVVRGVLNEFMLTPGTNNSNLTPSLWVKSGAAYDPNGDRIVIEDESITYDLARPLTTTNDGLNNFISTPLSTGSKNIPLSPGSINYIWIEYLSTTDTSVFTSHKITHAKQYYKREDGYKITVSLLPPSILAIPLGYVDLVSGGAVTTANIFKTNRTYSSIPLNQVLIHTTKSDKSDRTLAYNSDTTYLVDDHIKAVGTGNITPANPHGLSLADLGGGTLTVTAHQTDAHTGGIIGSTQSLEANITVQTPLWDIMTVGPLVGDAAVLTSDGKKLISTSFPYTSDLGTPSTNFFTDNDQIGTWYIYVDSLDGVVKKTQVNLLTSPDITKLLIYSVDWLFVGGADYNLDNLVDLRPFGSIGSKDIQYPQVFKKGTTVGRPADPKPGQLYINDTLSIIERYNRGDWDNGTHTWINPRWESVATNVPPGTRMIFYQPAAPTGWVQIMTHNDKALRVVSSAGGGSGGTHPISTGHNHTVTLGASGAHSYSGTTGGTALSIAQLPSHSHTYTRHSTAFDCSIRGGGGDCVLRYNSDAVQSTSSIGSGASHTHSFSFSVADHNHGTAVSTAIMQYVDVIICEKL